MGSHITQLGRRLSHGHFLGSMYRSDGDANLELPQVNVSGDDSGDDSGDVRLHSSNSFCDYLASM